MVNFFWLKNSQIIIGDFEVISPLFLQYYRFFMNKKMGIFPTVLEEGNQIVTVKSLSIQVNNGHGACKSPEHKGFISQFLWKDFSQVAFLLLCPAGWRHHRHRVLHNRVFFFFEQTTMESKQAISYA